MNFKNTLASATPGMEEISSKEIGVFVQNADLIAKAFDGLVIVAHHSPKLSDGMRGSGALARLRESCLDSFGPNSEKPVLRFCFRCHDRY